MAMTDHMQFGRALEQWNVKFPADALKVAEMWQTVTNLRVESPVGALRDGVQSGEIGPGDIVEAVERAAATMAAAEKSTAVIAELDFPMSKRFHRAVAEVADDLVTQLKPHFDSRAARLTEAATHLPADATTDYVVGAGADALAAWHALDHAARDLDSIAALRYTLARQYGCASGSPEVAMFLAPGVLTADELTHAERLRLGVENAARFEPIRGDGRGHWAHLVRAGFVLTLNTRAEALAVLASVAQPARV